MLGQIDIVITLFFVISLIFAIRGSFPLSSLFVGLSALLKPTGLLLIPILLFASYRRFGVKTTLLSFISGFGVFVLGVLPFIGSAGYRATALFANHIQKTVFAGIAISPGYVIPLFFIGYSLCLILYLNKRLSLVYALGLALFSSLAFISLKLKRGIITPCLFSISS